MMVRLKVLSGKSAGKEIKLRPGQFVIGRSDGCDLRPRTDAVSRKHCVFLVGEEGVRVRDLKSRNGTEVNGKKIEQEVELKAGDRITVGPLQFELIIKKQTADGPQPVPSAPKRPQGTTVAQGKQQAGGGSGSVADEDVFSWLVEGDEVDREARLADPETRQFKMGKSDRADTETVDMGGEAATGDTNAGKKKKEPGKLPKPPSKAPTENSQEAAADALREFFKRQ